MKLKNIILYPVLLALLTLPAAAAVAVPKVDFSGTWELDRPNSEGVPPDMKRIMVIVHSGDEIKVAEKIISKEDNQTLSEEYKIDGQETEFIPAGPNGLKGRGRRTVKWSDDGRGFIIDAETTFDVPDEKSPDIRKPVTGYSTRHWLLSSDGKTLTIESVIKGPRGEVRTKRVYLKKADK